jgi:hypothetical protein
LIKKIKKLNIPFFIVRFGSSEDLLFDFNQFMKVDIDCCDFRQQYANANGENSKVKRMLQTKISERVKEHVKHINIISD